MGERKGTNHYYPPDYDPRVGGLNKFMGTHALRERARKIHLGILIIRFEMPYNIWCDGCGNHIGMGVRYNAEKKKIGMYYTTPIYQFRMKCHLCDNHFEIKTDPGNLDYIILSGARRQENRWDPTQNEQIVPEDKDTQKKLFDDAMFKLEHGKGDEDTASQMAPRINKIVARNKAWKDDFSINQALRSKLRAERKSKIVTDAPEYSKNTGIPLLQTNSEDRKIAASLLRNSKKTKCVLHKKTSKVNVLSSSAASTITHKSLGIKVPTKPSSSSALSLVNQYNFSDDDDD